MGEGFTKRWVKDRASEKVALKGIFKPRIHNVTSSLEWISHPMSGYSLKMFFGAWEFGRVWGSSILELFGLSQRGQNHEISKSADQFLVSPTIMKSFTCNDKHQWASHLYWAYHEHDQQNSPNAAEPSYEIVQHFTEEGWTGMECLQLLGGLDGVCSQAIDFGLEALGILQEFLECESFCLQVNLRAKGK